MSNASPKNSAGLHAVMIALILSATISCIHLCGEDHIRATSERHGLHSGLRASNTASPLAVANSTVVAGHSKGRNIAMVAASEILPTTADSPVSPLVGSVLLDLTILVILLFLLRSIVLHPLRQLHSALPHVEDDATGSSHR